MKLVALVVLYTIVYYEPGGTGCAIHFIMKLVALVVLYTIVYYEAGGTGCAIHYSLL